MPIKAAPGMQSGIALEGAEVASRKSWHFAALFDLNLDTLSLKLGQDKLGNLLPFRTDLRLMAAYQVHSRVEIALDLPLTVFQADNFALLRSNGFEEPGVSAVGLGDIRVVPRISLLSQKYFPIGLAAIAEVRLPTGDGKSFLGDEGLVFAPRLAIERSFGALQILGNLGYRLRPSHGQFLNLYVGNEFAMGAGAILSLPNLVLPGQQLFPISDLKVLAEMHLSTPTERPFTFEQADSLKTPWELLLGARARVARNWNAELTLGRGLGVQTGYGRETLRVMFGMRYQFQHSDRDGDGMADEVDACPDDPEDFDGFKDSDGCPEPDNDGDGVLDPDDQCPLDPGPVELEGCPDLDKDGLPDLIDKCPDQGGPAESEGCPVEETAQVVLESDRIRVRGEIMFETNEAVIQSQSFKMLDDVHKVLADNPEVGPVLIEGHTDNRGSRKHNQGLSERRAKAVVDYLVAKGIKANRLKSAGFGFERPIADNETAIGRAKNRRTEFRLVKQDSDDEKPEAKPDEGASAPPAGSFDLTVERNKPAAPAPGPAAPAPGPAAPAPDAGTP